ncbi:MAG: hypothetical protein J0L66_07340 [Cytophagales bacterium]|nr:hypothetical protein [Cytophagales bacterium]
MSAQTLYYWQVTGTLVAFLPVLAGLLKYPKSEKSIRYFLGYLFIGLLTDLTGWYCYITQNETTNQYVRHAYDLFEAFFLFWFIAHTATSKYLRNFFSWALPVVVVFWASRFWISTVPMFKSGTQVVIAFGSALAILQMLEQDEQATQRPMLWMWLGTFFYCFSTFFLMGILGTKMAGVWYAHAIINILAYLIFTVGFLSIRQQSIPNSHN